MAAVKQVLCNVGKETYGIDISHVKGIEKYMNIISIPNAPSYVEGIINLRGDVIPVFNLHDKFHQSKEQVTEDTKLIIANSNGILIAFMVDMVSEIVEVEEKNFNPAPIIVENEDTRYIDSIVQVGEKLVVVLDLDGILSSKEQEKIHTILKEQ